MVEVTRKYRSGRGLLGRAHFGIANWWEQSAVDRIGSAFFTGADGTLMTPTHVFDGCRGLEMDEATFSVTVAAVDRSSDVAILKANLPGSVRTLEFRNEGKIAVDEPIYLRRFSVGECLGPIRELRLAASAGWAKSMATPRVSASP